MNPIIRHPKVVEAHDRKASIVIVELPDVAGSDVIVDVRIVAPGFDIIGDAMRSVSVKAPAEFNIRAHREPGFANISIDFFHGGNHIGTTSFNIEVRPSSHLVGMTPKKKLPFSKTYPVGTVCETIPPFYSGSLLVFTPGIEVSELWLPFDGNWIAPDGTTRSNAALQHPEDPRRCVLLGNLQNHAILSAAVYEAATIDMIDRLRDDGL